MDFIRVGVIGIGNMGSAHCNCIAKGEIRGLQLVAVCDVDTDRLSWIKEKYNELRTYTNYNDLISDNHIDAVIIAVPHPMHSEISIKALENGKHVLLEKPADISVSKVKQLNEVAKNTDKVFCIMFNQRTNPLFKKAREIVNSGMLGELKRSVWIVTNWYRTQSYYDSGNWRATWAGEGGGVLINQAPHNLDLWQWICGMPKSVTAFCDVAKFHNIEVEDDVTIFAKYKNEATGLFVVSTGEYPGTNRLEISGEYGKIILENGVLKWWKLKESERDVCINSNDGFAQIEYDYVEFKQENSETGHKIILQNFADAILRGEKLISPGIDGVNELEISNAAYLSAWNENKEVLIPFDAQSFDDELKKLVDSSKYKKVNRSTKTTSEYKKRWDVNWML